MHIEFRELTLHNFMSFGDAHLSFRDDGFIRVTGINENPDDNATSNGAGKSSLWEALVWALTGETIRGTSQIENLQGEDGTYVEIEFSIDKVPYKIIRAKNHKKFKTSLQIFIDGKDCSGKGVRDSNKLLAEYLPDITPSLLGSVIILGQGLPQKFTNNSPSGRKEVLEKLSKSDFMIEDLKTRVTKRKMEISTLIRTHQDNIISITSKQSILNNQISNAKLKLDTLDKSSLQEKSSIVFEHLNGAQEKNNSITEELNKINAKRDILSQRQQSELQKHQEELTQLEAKYFDTINSHQNGRNELVGRINSVNREITRIKNIKDICPTCGQKLQGVEKPHVEPFLIEMEELQKDLSVVDNLIAQINSEKNSEKTKLVDFYNLSNTVTTNDLNSLKIKYSCLINDQKNLISDINIMQSEYNNLQASIASIDATIESLNSSIIHNQEELVTLSSELEYNNTQKDIQQSHLDIISKFETALKRDFRGYLLTTIIDYISSRAKEYCNVIFETDKITFGLDGNNIEISYLDKAYENLSGGEKQKIDLIIQFSIRDMLCNHLGFTSNILVLDEVFDGLDMFGCQKVLDVISAMTDVKNIFIVTHRKDLSIPTDKEIVVIKNSNGISELR